MKEVESSVAEWISAREAVLRVAKAAGTNPEGAINNIIVKRARFAALRARYLGRTEKRGDRYAPATSIGRNGSVPQWLWERYDDSHGRFYFDWSTGVLSGDFHENMQRIQIELSGVEFSRADIDAIAPPEAESIRPGSQKASTSGGDDGRRGAPRQEEKWNNWIAALAFLAADGQVKGTLRQSQLIDLVADYLAAQGADGLVAPGKSSVQSAANAVLERFREEGI